MERRDPSPVFVGREAELKELLDDADAARREASTAVLITGEAGVGKSRLLREYADRAAMGRVVTGGCLELGVEGLPFAPFVTVLRLLARGTDLTPEQRPREMARLLPELGPVPESADEGRARMFEEVLTFFEAAAEPDGLTVIVEDLHWADTSTRDLLVFLLRNLLTARVQLLISFRTDDLHRSHPLRRLLPELERLPSVGRLDLAPLGREEVARQAAGIRGEDLPARDVDLIYERSGGNPLFVESFMEYRDLATAPVPEGPRELLLGALRPLDDTARSVLKSVALGGDRVSHELLATVTDLPADELDVALRAAIDANVLRTSGDHYVFRHALLAEAVQEDLLPGERVRLHRRFADALEAGVPGLAPRAAAARLAHHAYAAHDLPRALEAAWRVARHARGALAHPEALDMVERVLELWEQVPDAAERISTPHARVLWRASLIARALGRPLRAIEYASEALDQWLPSFPTADFSGYDHLPEEDRVLLADLLHARGEARREMAGDGALEDLGWALRVMPDKHRGRAKVLAAMASTLMMRGHDDDAARGARRALDLARTVGDRRSEADALITLGTVIGHDRTSGAQGRGLLEEAARIAREIERPLVEFRAVVNLGALLKYSGRFGDAVQTWRAGLERARQLGLLRAQGALFVVGVADGLILLGRLEDARAVLQSVSGAENPLGRARMLTSSAEIHLLQGSLSAAREAVDEFYRVLPEHTSAPAQFLGMRVLQVDLALATGQLDRAVERVLDLLHEERPWMRRWIWLSHVLVPIAAVVARLRREVQRDPAYEEPAEEVAAGLRRFIGMIERHGDRVHRPIEKVTLPMSRALLADEPEEEYGYWRAAVAGARRFSSRIELIRSLTGFAECAVELGDRETAEQSLTEARALAEECSAGALLREVVRVAEESGLAVPPPGSADEGASSPSSPGRDQSGGGEDPIAALTPRETEVLAMITRGCTNREIANELMISIKTVSVHVSDVLAKLGVSNRNAAAVRARDAGMT
ncbi:helix-turn-helix transcriptional regulator [Nocardiopsis gilva YIM 90087]|uniref:Helix-turn-helix transcriptional regulator n=2 Tax=Nocardiopsis gilva TaxID=280236 RepID=A0A223SDE5_9ACTN|nr:helix-turn-helix transcriptional regulator [Nocardiopsis gilva]ASU86168.1 helix-turn-helix transcriptional regulator [Nocardiopsis gilva YIM 90087]